MLVGKLSLPDVAVFVFVTAAAESIFFPAFGRVKTAAVAAAIAEATMLVAAVAAAVCSCMKDVGAGAGRSGAVDRATEGLALLFFFFFTVVLLFMITLPSPPPAPLFPFPPPPPPAAIARPPPANVAGGVGAGVGAVRGGVASNTGWGGGADNIVLAVVGFVGVGVVERIWTECVLPEVGFSTIYEAFFFSSTLTSTPCRSLFFPVLQPVTVTHSGSAAAELGAFDGEEKEGGRGVVADRKEVGDVLLILFDEACATGAAAAAAAGVWLEGAAAVRVPPTMVNSPLADSLFGILTSFSPYPMVATLKIVKLSIFSLIVDATKAKSERCCLGEGHKEGSRHRWRCRCRRRGSCGRQRFRRRRGPAHGDCKSM